MLSKKFAVVLALVCLVCFVKADGDVVALNGSEFEDEIGKYDIGLVKFYAPWCGYCKKLAPEFEKAATELKSNNPSITLIDVDCTVDQELCDKFGVQGYPTLKFFRKGEVVGDYQGPRDAAGIAKFVVEQVSENFKSFEKSEGSEHVVALTAENFDEELEEHQLSVVKFFAPWCGHCKQIKSEFEKAALELLNSKSPVAFFEVDCTVEKELCQKFEIQGIPTLKIFHKGEFVDNYQGPRDAIGIAKYFTEQASDFVKNFVKANGSGQNVAAKIKGKVDDLVDQAKQKKDDLVDQVKAKKDDLVGKVHEKKDDLIGKVHEKKDELVGKAHEKKDEIVDQVDEKDEL